MATKLTKAFAEFVGGRCIGGIQKRLKRILSADFTVEMDSRLSLIFHSR